MVDKNKEFVNYQRKFDKSVSKSYVSERRIMEGANSEARSTHHIVDNSKDIYYQEMNSQPKERHSNSSLLVLASRSLSSKSKISTPSTSINSTDDCVSGKNNQKTAEIIPTSSEKSVCAIAPACSNGNAFANDGSFMAMYRKKIHEEEMKKQNEAKGVKRPVETAEKEKTSPKPGSSFNLPLVGRRKGPKMLKTGIVVKKVKEDEKEEDTNSDAWSKYLAEVRKYKSQKCIEDDGGSTPLVK